ncbi:MAG: hypothetical protein JWN70_1334 [Planctomycetaceae bacterium]|nr:hypothetical protein [Planctomycetaceae bacterium]
MYADQSVLEMPESTTTTPSSETESSVPVISKECSSCLNAEESTGEIHNTSSENAVEMLGQLPSEMATLLILAGIAGVVLPGPVGTPMLIAGCVIMWPKTFRPIETWFSRSFPRFHREGVIQIKEFVYDLKQRFPDVK